jgi:hypothetical protein
VLPPSCRDEAIRAPPASKWAMRALRPGMSCRFCIRTRQRQRQRQHSPGTRPGCWSWAGGTQHSHDHHNHHLPPSCHYRVPGPRQAQTADASKWAAMPPRRGTNCTADSQGHGIAEVFFFFFSSSYFCTFVMSRFGIVIASPIVRPHCVGTWAIVGQD